MKPVRVRAERARPEQAQERAELVRVRAERVQAARVPVRVERVAAPVSQVRQEPALKRVRAARGAEWEQRSKGLRFPAGCSSLPS